MSKYEHQKKTDICLKEKLCTLSNSILIAVFIIFKVTLLFIYLNLDLKFILNSEFIKGETVSSFILGKKCFEVYIFVLVLKLIC